MLDVVMRDERRPEIPVRFYRTEAGGAPVLDWLRSLDKGDRRVIELDLMRVQLGWPIGRPLVGSLKDGLWEALVASEPADRPAHPVLSRSDACRAARVY
jgi:hypothetical protein